MLIKRAQDVGKSGGAKYVWHACVDCGKERWVQLQKDNKPVSSRCCSCEIKRRELSAHWKGGQILKKGYVLILKPEHPRANNHGYVKRAILVLEEKLGRYLLNDAVAHHINGIKDDDGLENLEEVMFGEHSRNHMLKTWRQRKAGGCLGYE